jgi:hypothetical protein
MPSAAIRLIGDPILATPAGRSPTSGTTRLELRRPVDKFTELATFVHLLLPLATHVGLLHDVRAQGTSCLMNRRLEYSGLVTSRLLS